MNEQLTKSQIKAQIINAAVQEYINAPKFKKSIAKISNKYGINKKTLAKYLKEQNVEVISVRCAKQINEFVFNKIDSEEKAYWLGFLYADGYVSAKTNHVGVSVAIKDITHLEKFKNFLEWEGDIKISKEHQFGSKKAVNSKGEEMFRCSITIGNKEIHDDLVKLGCVPNKSLILKFPNEEQVPKQFQKAFVRGYFDGDGTLGLYKHSTKNSRLEESLIIVGTKPMLEGIQKILGRGYLIQKKNCNQSVYRLGYSTLNAYNAATIMYSNASIYLDRKYDIYINKYCPYRAKTVKAEMLIPC